jgi:hypothetical protein
MMPVGQAMTHDGPQRGVVMPAMVLRREVRGKFGSLSHTQLQHQNCCAAP